MIQTSALCRSFRGRAGADVTALDHVEFAVRQGEFVTVVGPSGSGKSTLLFTLGGLLRPTSGQVTLAGVNVYDLNAGKRARFRLQQIGFVFQTFNLVPYLSCVENVALPAVLAGETDSRAQGRAREILDRLGLGPRIRHRPAELSVGERQRVGLGRAIINTPAIVLADEPTGNLDPDAANDVVGLLCDLHAAGQTVVLVTHDPHVADAGDRVVALQRGRIERPPEPQVPTWA